MKYACLIYSDETANPGHDAPEFAPIMEAYMQFGQESSAAGVYVAGEPLEPTSTATSVQLRDGEIITTDGPFAETKEQLGGFYILDCESLDDAIKWAAKIPTAAMGTIEVRPIPNLG